MREREKRANLVDLDKDHYMKPFHEKVTHKLQREQPIIEVLRI